MNHLHQELHTHMSNLIYAWDRLLLWIHIWVTGTLDPLILQVHKSWQVAEARGVSWSDQVVWSEGDKSLNFWTVHVSCVHADVNRSTMGVNQTIRMTRKHCLWFLSSPSSSTKYRVSPMGLLQPFTTFTNTPCLNSTPAKVQVAE